MKRGAAVVAGAIAGARMSAVNFAEVVSHFIHVGMPPDEVDAMLAPLPLIVVDADAALATKAGRLRRATAEAGLSLGDRFCLALAARDRLAGLDRRSPVAHDLEQKSTPRSSSSARANSDHSVSYPQTLK